MKALGIFVCVVAVPTCLAFSVPVSPDQTAMVQFVSPVLGPCGGRFPFAQNTSIDVCSWQGITCNSDQRVTEIQFSNNDYYYECSGTAAINTMLLPPMTKILVLTFDDDWYDDNLHYTGTLSFAAGSLLEKIVVPQNQFTYIDLTNLPANLIWLDVSQNAIAAPATLTSIPSTIMYFHIHQNRFTGTLDLTKLPPMLTTFSAYENMIDSVIVSAALPALFSESLDLHQNSIASITGTAGSINSAEVLLHNNSLHQSSFTWTLFSPQVQTLTLDFNSISTLNLAALPTGLQSLSVTNNSLKSVILAGGNPSLSTLDLSNNMLPTLQWTQLPRNLSTLGVFNNLLTAVDMSNLPSTLRTIGSGYNNMDVSFAGNMISSITFPASMPSGLTPCTIDLSNQRFTTFDFTKVPDQVTGLSLTKNQIASVFFPSSNQPSQLSSLDLSYNLLTSISWGLLPQSLTWLSLQYNMLSQADFSHLPPQLVNFPNYQQISMQGNVLSDVIFGQLPAGITSLDLSGQRISVISFGGATNKQVVYVDLSANLLTSQNLHLSNLPTALNELVVAQNNLTTILCEHLPTTLSILRASHNQISSVVFALSGRLSTVDLSHNALSTLALSTIPVSMVKLRLNNNRLSSLTGSVVAGSSLELLDLDFNVLSTVPFTGLPSGLRELHLRGNQLAEPFNRWVGLFQKLEALDVSQNLLGPSLSFANVSSSLSTLMINGNQLSGILDFSLLPSTLINLGIAHNEFTGPLPTVPKTGSSLQVLLAGFNKFSGTLPSVNQRPLADYMDLSYNQLWGSVNFSAGSWPSTLLLRGNKLTGQVLLANTGFFVLDLSDNGFTGTPTLPTRYCPGCVIDLNQTNICGTTAMTQVFCSNLVVPKRCTLKSPQSGSYNCQIVCPSC